MAPALQQIVKCQILVTVILASFWVYSSPLLMVRVARHPVGSLKETAQEPTQASS